MQAELTNMTNEEIVSKTKMFESNIRAMNSEMRRYTHDTSPLNLSFRTKITTFKQRVSTTKSRKTPRKSS